MNSATDFLNRLVGRWDLTGQMGQTPLQQSVECHWVLGGLFVQLYFKSVLPTAEGTTPYEALYHIGYNEQQDVYVLHLLDTFGVGATCIVGVGKREGDSIPFVFGYEGGPFTNRLSWDAATVAWTFDLTYLQDNAVQVFATKRMVRQA